MPVRTTGKLKVIPATIKIHNVSANRRRVCGYARVSTDNEEQQTSYKSQVDYYTNFIMSNTNWEFVGLYSDEGISATNTKKRDGFNKMVSDALDGKIDLIITKSISRFARNTVDSLSTIRKLKEKNVEVYFEKENIYTFDSKGELMISLLSSLAQDESRSISENTTWGIRKRFSDGFVRMRYNNFMGYELGKDGKATIVKEDAKVIKLIYKLFMEGYGYRTIAKYLMERGILSPGGCKIWRGNTIKSILTNERYIGDALLQKNFTVDFLNKKSKKNEGEVPQYYIENDHDAIISKELFNIVQEKVKNRSAEFNGANTLSNKLICGYCGSKFGKKTWHSTDIYKKCIYQCNAKFEKKCKNRNLTEKEIQDIFVTALNQVIENKDEIIGNIEEVLKFIDNTKLEKERDKLERDLMKLIEVINNNVYESATSKKNTSQDDNIKKYDNLKKKLDEIESKISTNNERKSKLELYVSNLKKQRIVNEFSLEMWGMFIDKMLIYKDKIKVIFNDGREIVV